MASSQSSGLARCRSGPEWLPVSCVKVVVGRANQRRPLGCPWDHLRDMQRILSSRTEGSGAVGQQWIRPCSKKSDLQQLLLSQCDGNRTAGSDESLLLSCLQKHPHEMAGSDQFIKPGITNSVHYDNISIFHIFHLRHNLDTNFHIVSSIYSGPLNLQMSPDCEVQTKLFGARQNVSAFD